MIHIIIICTVKIVEFYPKLEDPKTRNGSVWSPHCGPLQHHLHLKLVRDSGLS